MVLQFFAGANSETGFRSLFPALCAEQARRVYVIKSGPGCGKSTCIRHLSDALGGAQELLRCSSDPDSLDGAVFDDVLILDGTAPHVWEPAFPGCNGDYLTLPPFLDAHGLRQQAAALTALQTASAAHYAQVYRLIRAAALTGQRRTQAVRALLPEGKPENRARGIAEREFPQTGQTGQLRLRFLDGITPKGRLFLWETVAACADRVFILQDSYGLAQPLLEALRDCALERGHTVYSCMDPITPERVLHLLLPQLGLAFISDDGQRELPFVPFRRIRLDAMLSPEALRPLRGSLRLCARLRDALLEDAVSQLCSAHSLHDRIEEIYRPHIHISAMNEAYEQLAAQIRMQS